ncbi:glycosyltransferase [Lacinutrix sp. Hel_I_90]|uniref:glycosyltransferase n=1 Tax=Lacinutrix sp. Hel_I_90 TaxID=1249999 RepID=UPI0005CA60CB|nr:glycosyltransferase [Lacinutrix sp. Hel_I_90]
MKILMVAIPNHHFFQWVNQLKDAGHEVIWFDITDGGPKADKIDWVKQIKGWKLRWDFPMRSRVKTKWPELYKWLLKYNTKSTSKVFEQLLKQEKPDIVHCFEMQLAGFPILQTMQTNTIPFIYSSWGSDLFYFEQKGFSKLEVETFLQRVNYLITDCKRDYGIALSHQFKGVFLGVFPGNGGLTLDPIAIKPTRERRVILIKGYDDGLGKASIVLSALETISKETLAAFEIIIYSADTSIQSVVRNSKKLSALNIKIQSRYQFMKNKQLLEIMGSTAIHIANSLSDGMPNALLEAMGMGAFPIQSNPGRVTEEVITNSVNGFLIDNPLDENRIAVLIKEAIFNETLRESAQGYNVTFIKENYNRIALKPKIVTLYNTILLKRN